MKNTIQSHHAIRRKSLAWGAAICLGCAGGWLHAQETAPAPAPKIQFDHIRHDFGRVRSGSVMKHEFPFTNAGGAELVITQVQPSCGCTTLTEYRSHIPPGEKGSLPLEFNSQGLLGDVHKTLLVQSNDPEQPSLVLSIVGQFWQPVEIYPAVALMFLPPHTEQSLSTTIRIVNKMDEPLELKEPVSSVPQFRARVEEVAAGKEFHLILDTVPPFDHQDIQGTIRVETSSPHLPVAEISAVLIAQPEIMVNPTQLFLPAVPPDVPEPYLITLRNQSPGEITIDHASCDAPGSEVVVRETRKGRDFQIAVTFPPDFAHVPDKSYGITIRTSLPGQEPIIIPVAFAGAPPANPPRQR